MSELPVRARLILLALCAALAAAALLRLASSGQLSQYAALLQTAATGGGGGGPERALLAQVYAKEPVEKGTPIVVCAAVVEANGTYARVLNVNVTARATTDYVNYRVATFPSGTCTVMEAPNAVTNVLEVEVEGGGLQRVLTLRAAGRIMVATDQLIAALAIGNAIQAVAIAVLLYKVLK